MLFISVFTGPLRRKVPTLRRISFFFEQGSVESVSLHC